jgi:hypothetical protein
MAGSGIVGAAATVTDCKLKCLLSMQGSDDGRRVGCEVMSGWWRWKRSGVGGGGKCEVQEVDSQARAAEEIPARRPTCSQGQHEEQHRCGWRLSLFLGDLRPCCSSARDRRQ